MGFIGATFGARPESLGIAFHLSVSKCGFLLLSKKGSGRVLAAGSEGPAGLTLLFADTA